MPPATAALLHELLALTAASPPASPSSTPAASPSPSPAPSAAARPPLHWRRALVANVQLALLAPPPGGEMTSTLVAHLLASLAAELPGVRALAMGGLASLLPVSAAAAARQVCDDINCCWICRFIKHWNHSLLSQRHGSCQR